VTNEADNSITIHVYESGDLKKTFSTKPYGLRPRGIKVSPDGKFYVATLEFSDNFIVLDKEFNHVKTVKTGKSPYGISFNSKGDKLYVAAGRAKTLEVFDGKDFTKINELNTEGKRCWHFTFTPDNKNILLACGRSDEVLVIDSDTLNITKRIPVAGIPWGIVTYPKAIGSLDQAK
jgi:YVTN family beta-propeller protein